MFKIYLIANLSLMKLFLAGNYKLSENVTKRSLGFSKSTETGKFSLKIRNGIKYHLS